MMSFRKRKKVKKIGNTKNQENPKITKKRRNPNH